MEHFWYIKDVNKFSPGKGGGFTGVGGPQNGAPTDEDGNRCLVGCICPVGCKRLTSLPPLCWLAPCLPLPTNNYKSVACVSIVN